MTADQRFVDQVLGRLLPLGPVRGRRMFGGWGIFLDDVMFALIAGDRLYLKVDAETEHRFADAGAEPFTYRRGDGKAIVMSYREAPEGTIDDTDALLPWAGLALEAARRAQTSKKPRRRRR